MSATAMKTRYEGLVASRRCVQCRAGLLDEDGDHVRCGDCRDKNARKGRTQRGRRMRRGWTRRFYAKHRDELLVKYSEARQRKKVLQICRDCPLPSLEDSIYCLVHRLQQLYRQRKQGGRMSMNSWDEAEKKFPECSAAWDRDGGPAWLGDAKPVFVMFDKTLAIGYGHAPHASWALWNEHTMTWIFIRGSRADPKETAAEVRIHVKRSRGARRPSVADILAVKSPTAWPARSRRR